MFEIVHNTSPLYVKTTDVPLTKTRKAFIRHFLENKAYPSYSDVDCRNQQCSAARNRSLTELHQMTLARFPKTSFEAILRIVKELIDEDAGIRLTYCTTINKAVLRYVPRGQREYATPSSIRDYGDTKGVDGYSLNQYVEVLNNL